MRGPNCGQIDRDDAPQRICNAFQRPDEAQDVSSQIPR